MQRLDARGPSRLLSNSCSLEGNHDRTTDARNTVEGSVKVCTGKGAFRAPFTVQDVIGLWDGLASIAHSTMNLLRTS